MKRLQRFQGEWGPQHQEDSFPWTSRTDSWEGDIKRDEDPTRYREGDEAPTLEWGGRSNLLQRGKRTVLLAHGAQVLSSVDHGLLNE